MRKAIRRFLRLDGWGQDIYRLKRRMGTVVQDQDTLNAWVVDLDEELGLLREQNHSLEYSLSVATGLLQEIEQLLTDASPVSTSDASMVHTENTQRHEGVNYFHQPFE